MRYFLFKTRSVCHLHPGELTHTGRKYDIHTAFCNLGRLWMDVCIVAGIALSKYFCCSSVLLSWPLSSPFLSQNLCSLLQYDQALPLCFHADMRPAAPSHSSSLQQVCAPRITYELDSSCFALLCVQELKSWISRPSWEKSMASFNWTGAVRPPHLRSTVRTEGEMARSTSDPEKCERPVNPNSSNGEVSGRVCVAC